MKNSLILLICLFAIAVCNAQQPTKAQVDSIRQAVVNEMNPKIDEFLKEKPVILICFNERLKTAHLFTIKGYVRAGIYGDDKHRALPDWVTVVQAIEPKKKGKKKP